MNKGYYSISTNRTKVLQVGFKSVLAHLSIVLKLSYWSQSMSVVHRVCRQQLEIYHWANFHRNVPSTKVNLIRQNMTRGVAGVNKVWHGYFLDDPLQNSSFKNIAATGCDLWQIRKLLESSLKPLIRVQNYLTEMTTTFHNKSYNEFDPL